MMLAVLNVSNLDDKVIKITFYESYSQSLTPISISSPSSSVISSPSSVISSPSVGVSVISVIIRFGAGFSFGIGFSISFDNMYGSTRVGIICVWFNCHSRSNGSSIGHGRMSKGVWMVGIWIPSNSVVKGGRVVSVVSSIQHSWFGFSFFGFTFLNGMLVWFSITFPPVSVWVSISVVSP